LGKDVDEVLLIGLAESQSIDQSLLTKPSKLHHVTAEGPFEDVPLHFGTIEHPPGSQSASVCQIAGEPLKAQPRGTGQALVEDDVFEVFRQTPPDDQPSITLNPSLPLFQIQRVRGQVPMDNARTPRMEV
jgi:hypothetical protein